jgi:hypothetical protein
MFNLSYGMWNQSEPVESGVRTYTGAKFANTVKDSWKINPIL